MSRPHRPQITLHPWEGHVKIKLSRDTLSVDSFETCEMPDAGRGTVQAHQASRACNTRSPFCQLPSVNQPCITDEVECTA
jgi:hypothetical protein